MLPDNEQLILEKAINAIYRETGLRLEIIELQKKEQQFRIDAVLGIKGYEPLQFAAEIKQWAQHINFGAVVEQIKRLPMRGILVADYVNPNMAERLKKEDVQFIDTAGNAYIKALPLYIFVKGNRQPHIEIQKKDEKTRAFAQTGLKVIFAFLCDPELINAPYRQIADIVDVALGTVGWVVYDLKAAGFIIDRGGKRGRRLTQYQKLLNRWVETYPEKLRPKQFVGEYKTDNPWWWENFNIEKHNAYWGGEIAGAKYTNYLKPEVATVYLPEEAGNKFMAEARLYKAEYKGARVKIYRPFWQKPENYNGLVHPVLAYADLVATGDARNLETARMIHEQYITQYIRED